MKNNMRRPMDECAPTKLNAFDCSHLDYVITSFVSL